MLHPLAGALAPHCAMSPRVQRRWIVLACVAVSLSGPAAAAAAGLSLADAIDLARQSAPALRAGEAALASATLVRPAAGTLPDPRLAAGVESLPIAGADRFSSTRDTTTLQRLALMQEVPNRAKRDARLALAQARIERERATLAVIARAVQRDTALAWLSVYHAERRRGVLQALHRENQLLQDTLPARIAGGRSMPAELTMARQEALAIADRSDELDGAVRRARAELRRWVGARADEPLLDAPPGPEPSADEARAKLHRNLELAVYGPMREMALAESAEADAEQRGDWSWEVAYNRRPRYDDMVSFQLVFELPWQRERRQQPMVQAKRKEAERIEAERDDAVRRHAAELEGLLAERATVQAQLARLQGAGLALAAERIDLALASYQAGRSDLGAVLAARGQALDLRLRAIELEAQRDALRVRLNTLTVE